MKKKVKYYWFHKSNTRVVTTGPGTIKPSGEPKFTVGLNGFRVILGYLSGSMGAALVEYVW